MTFETLHPLLAQALTTKGYEALTPVQSEVTQEEAHGRDLIVSAQTGSGKTVAFGLAMAGELLGDADRLPPPAWPLALVIAPTRELALQVSRELEWLYAGARARIATCVGGMDAAKERRALSQGAHIVVGTPGRLRDHLERGALDLSALKTAVLDEADEMLDMGFREDLEGILDATGEGRRTLLFSATMPKPIVALARRYQKDALQIATISAERGHGDISYQAMTVAPADIENAVVNLLRFHEAETAILFCATRDNVRHLHASLTERGFAAVALSGEHSQNERNHALQALRDKRARVCVATDVAARGIDLPTLTLVVHVELPRDAETMQHRSGRTGRAGKKGTAVLIVPYPRRRRVESMLKGAKIPVEWTTAPSKEQIAAQDAERLRARLLEPMELEESDWALGGELLEAKSAKEIAAMLVRSARAAMPAPEELLDASEAPARRDGPRPGFEDTQWFRMDIGRRQNADPRWILPLICRRGHVSRGDIGAIRITTNETMFEIPRAIASKFIASVKRTGEAGDEGADVTFEPTEGAPREEARENRKQLRPSNDSRPNRSGPPRGGPGGGRPHSPRPFKGAGAGGPRKGPPRSRG
ncbi:MULTISPECIES: DEAD/DEAH box helicase [Sphingobium]|jgi:ATP-dependent RNA helicase DeaD|uniref:DEAD/DEAH box helicase n=1 Tax=Sphingobium limneticum TaxID=1007511 RepID=A0A5J5I5L6_9SPHN|nr:MULTISPECIES: DEAD/DEAH box helicase [Sphingobium]KAA9015121.1 DEAD/DEAH box helicase [Sphingobium limneticum]KAA9016740.1 DEAD/DEAH box helicase [Sphingobium limneticum]KAA9029719.1 DEAD/DEAH box helicase [Sphingobium limneticum]MBU0933172.1 DEAD/DEAH box helicase [Alphaproteobacteria bacterium]